MKFFWPLLAVILVQIDAATEWDASNYPNPLTNGFRQCKMRSRANICDPDGILTEQERYRLNHDLQQLESLTYQDNAPTHCEKKGLTATMAVVRHVRGGSQSHVQAMANELVRKWNLDQQCQKGIVYVLSLDDRKFWVGRDPRVPVVGDEFRDIASAQNPLLQQGNIQQALANIIKGTVQKTNEKKVRKPGAPASDDGWKPQGGGGGGSGGGGGGIPFGLLKSIPLWVYVVILAVVIPTLLCCCLVYCCCCRNKDNQEVEGGGEGGQGGGGGGAFRNIAQGVGIQFAIQTCLDCVRNRNRNQGNQGGPGAYRPGVQRNDDGLYPNQPVKDEGGGTSW